VLSNNRRFHLGLFWSRLLQSRRRYRLRTRTPQARLRKWRSRVRSKTRTSMSMVILLGMHPCQTIAYRRERTRSKFGLLDTKHGAERSLLQRTRQRALALNCAGSLEQCDQSWRAQLAETLCGRIEVSRRRAWIMSRRDHDPLTNDDIAGGIFAFDLPHHSPFLRRSHDFSPTPDAQPPKPTSDLIHLQSSADGFSSAAGINDIALSASAVIVSDGFTPGFADIAAPSIT